MMGQPRRPNTWQSFVTLPLLPSVAVLFAWLAICDMSCLAQASRGQGVRARLYWIDGEVDPEKTLAPNQSPNLDVRIPQLTFDGDEAWFTNAGKTYKKQYVLVLEANLELEDAREFQVRLASEAPALLTLDGREVAFAEEGDPEIEDFEADAEHVALKIIQSVNDQPRWLDLRWRFDEDEPFEALPTESLTSDDFYFRPTNGGAKRLSDDEDRPGKYEKVVGVFPGIDLFPARPPGVEVPVGGLGTLPDGRLVVASFDARRLRAPVPQDEPDGELWLFSNLNDDDPAAIQRELIAEELYEPAGVCVVDESIFVSQRDEITRFDFKAAAGRWQPTTIATGWESNDFHALSFGLIHEAGQGGHPGYLLMARGTGLGLRKNPPNHGAVWRIDLSKPAGENLQAITGGHRTPNGIGFGPEGEIYVTDNQGEFTPANELNRVVEGSFYGFRQSTRKGGAASPFQDQETTPPAVFLPQDEIGNSPSEPLLIPNGWPYAGQILVGDVKYGGVNRVFLEKINGVWQGAAFRFTQGLEAGINRMAFSADGSLFVGGIGGDHSSTWNWVNPKGKKTYQGLQRLKPNGQLVFDLQQVEVTRKGLRVRFTKPIDKQWLGSTSNYRVSQWRYEPTPNYGGPKIEEREIYVTRAVPAKDLMAVDLEIEGRKTGHVIHLVADPQAEDGSQLWSTEAWYTLWEIPEK